MALPNQSHASPYVPPQAPLRHDVPTTRRKVWVAVVLGIVLPFVAFLYLARPVRAGAYLLAALALVVGVLLLPRWVPNPDFIDVSISGLRLGLSIIAAVDAYRLAKRWQGGFLPWYSRVPGLASLVLLLFAGIFSFRWLFLEPFRLPSESMRPTIERGEHFFVDKTVYGWNVPFSDRRLVTFGAPKRGEVAVFIYPENPELQYVKRVIGVPGESIRYDAKRLYINGQLVPVEIEEVAVPGGEGEQLPLMQFREDLDGVSHPILLNPEAPTYLRASVRSFPFRENCVHLDSGFTCRVPPGHYFVMGDNRDRSSDSRYWGFVPEANFIGRVNSIWMSESRERVGTEIK